MNQQPPTPASKPSNKPRRLTVGYAYTEAPGVRVPNLRLCGRWLHEAGFAIGRHVTIVNDARLTIAQVD